MPKPAFSLWKKALLICNMKTICLHFVVALLLVCLVPFQKAAAQNWDINFVREVNPQGTKSFFFRGLSASVYPVSLAIPVGTYLYGAKTKSNVYKNRAYEGLGSVVIAGIAATGFKVIFNRRRPYEKYTGVYPLQYESHGSLPSAHATLAFATATTLSLQYKKWYVVVPAYLWASGCSFSRIYLGEHYPSDVLAGAAIGTGSALVSRWITHKLFR